MPLLYNIVNNTYKKMTSQKVYDIFSLPLLSDVEKNFKRFSKENVDLQDYINFGLDMSEPLTGVPSKNFNRIQKQFTGFDFAKDFE